MKHLTRILRDNTISLHAKAMYCFVETMDGSVDPNRLHLYLKESPVFIEKAIKELKAAGYITVKYGNKKKEYITIRKEVKDPIFTDHY